MSSYRFDLEKAIAAWRRPLEHRRAISAEDLEELESSLRDRIEALVEAGRPEEAAFREALQRMGSYGTAEEEYRKVYWGKLRRQRELLRELYWRAAMVKNYLIVAFRNLLRQKGYSFINIAGLTLGMACSLILFQYVVYEYSFDQFNSKKDRIYRVTFKHTQNGENLGLSPYVGPIVGPTMAREVPGIAQYTRVHPDYGASVISYQSPDGDRTFTEDQILFVDSTFLNMFDYPLVKGNRARALREPQTILVSESMARKYFGEEEPVGKTLDLTGGWVRGAYTVAGVFEDVPPTSHMQFDFLLPMVDLLNNNYQGEGSQWGWLNFKTYLEMHPTPVVNAVETRITETYIRYRRDEFAATNTEAEAYLQPLTSIHLDTEVIDPSDVAGDRQRVYFFAAIGLITLVIALVNYVNLSTARAVDRAKEVGVRKVLGAQKAHLIKQFLMESALTNTLALGFAIALSLLLLPVLNSVAGVEMTRDIWLDGRFWAVLLGIFGVSALLSGLYPALVLSSFKPVVVLKGKSGPFASRAALRKGLVVIQFVASIALLAGTMIVYAQLGYMQGLDTGLDLEQILVVERPRVLTEGGKAGADMVTLKNELRKIPAVREAATSTTTPGRGFEGRTNVHRAAADPSTRVEVRLMVIDHDFAEVYGLELAAGEAFYEGMTVPDSDATPVVVNEEWVRTVGFASNEEAVNERIASGGGPGGVVKGVFRDFQWSSAHLETEPVMFVYSNGGNISMKIDMANLPATIEAVQRTYEAIFPGNPFNYYFADAAFAEQYRADRRFATLFGAFTGIAIMIACLGLFGLASFTAEQRTKEIGVRKVLGASVGSIVGLLSKDFLKLVAVAFVIAVPVAYFGMQRWLEDFAYRIEIGPGTFLLTGGLVLLIALLTVSYQAIKAALADPVKSLRYE